MSSEADVYLDCCAVPVIRNLDSYSGLLRDWKRRSDSAVSAFTTFTPAPMRSIELDERSKSPGYAAIN